MLAVSLLAAVVGCASTVPLEAPPTSWPTASPSPAPSESAPLPSEPPLIDVSVKTPSYAAVGDGAVEATAAGSEMPPNWSILPADQERVRVAKTIAPDGTTATARFTFVQPGLARVRATIGGHHAELEIAGIDVPTVSVPTIIVKTRTFRHACRLITSESEWRAFWAEGYVPDPARAQDPPPPVDFTQRSLVVLAAIEMPGMGGPPVVTHLDGRDIHVAFPGSKSLMTAHLSTPMPTTVLQTIPRMPSDARFVVSGSLFRVALPSNQEIVDIVATRSPRPTVSPAAFRL
jgi:hypothetical protein